MDMEDDLYDESVDEHQDPSKSILSATEEKYEKEYQRFLNHLARKGLEEVVTEENLLEYFGAQRRNGLSPRSLYTKFSMIKSRLMRIHNIDLTQFEELKAFLSDYSKVCKPVYVPNNFTKEQIRSFLTEASDSGHLLHKVVLILGICGGLKVNEMHRLENCHVIDEPTRIRVITKDRSTGNNDNDAAASEFSIYDNSQIQYAGIIRRYMVLRPEEAKCQRFLLSYKKGIVTDSGIGIPSISSVPPIVARFLKLPKPERFNGRSLRSTSMNMLSLSSRGKKLRKRNVVSAASEDNSNQSEVEKEESNATFIYNSGAQEEYIYHPEVQDTMPEVIIEKGLTKTFELPGTSASQADILSSLQLVKPDQKQKQHVFINCVFNIHFTGTDE